MGFPISHVGEIDFSRFLLWAEQHGTYVKVKGRLMEVIFNFDHVSSGDGTQVVRLSK